MTKKIKFKFSTVSLSFAGLTHFLFLDFFFKFPSQILKQVYLPYPIALKHGLFVISPDLTYFMILRCVSGATSQFGSHLH